MSGIDRSARSSCAWAIDEAGRDDHATGIHLSRALCAQGRSSNSGDTIACDCDIGAEARSAGAVDYRAIADDAVALLSAAHVDACSMGG
jgi:hypothetical protein